MGHDITGSANWKTIGRLRQCFSLISPMVPMLSLLFRRGPLWDYHVTSLFDSGNSNTGIGRPPLRQEKNGTQVAGFRNHCCSLWGATDNFTQPWQLQCQIVF